MWRIVGRHIPLLVCKTRSDRIVNISARGAQCAIQCLAAAGISIISPTVSRALNDQERERVPTKQIAFQKTDLLSLDHVTGNEG